MADDFGYHIDHHGSLVRPPQLLAARAAGLSGEALAAVTDEAVVRRLAHAAAPADPERHVRRAVPAGVLRVGDPRPGGRVRAGHRPGAAVRPGRDRRRAARAAPAAGALEPADGSRRPRRRPCSPPWTGRCSSPCRLPATWPRQDRRFLRRLSWTRRGRRARRSPRSCGTRSRAGRGRRALRGAGEPALRAAADGGRAGAAAAAAAWTCRPHWPRSSRRTAPSPTKPWSRSRTGCAKLTLNADYWGNEI